uniref:Uncharacterized protein n=1 Tax=Rhizophora mucronata TaxID=61149 RepID=A0A2P2PN75_RHIMU
MAKDCKMVKACELSREHLTYKLMFMARHKNG